MALDISGIVAGQIIQATHLTQFFNLFTGVMLDQPVLLKNQVTLGGNQSTGVVPLTVSGVASQTADIFDVKTNTGAILLGVAAGGTVTVGTGPLTITAGGLTVTAGGLTITAGGIAITAGGLTITAGGLTITAGGLTVTAGGLVITAGGLQATGATTVTGDASLFKGVTSNLATVVVRPFDDANATTSVLAVQNAAGSQNNWSVTKAGAVTQALGLTLSSGGITITSGNIALNAANPAIVGGTVTLSFNNNANNATNMQISDAGQVTIGRLGLLVSGTFATNVGVQLNTSGAFLYSGAGVPANGTGNNGDIYFRTDGGASTTIYQRRAGAWVATGA